MTKKRDLEVLLIKARRLGNQTCRLSDEVATWHRKTDRALAGAEGDDPEQRYDSPAHCEHREFVERVFDRRRSTL